MRTIATMIASIALFAIGCGGGEEIAPQPVVDSGLVDANDADSTPTDSGSDALVDAEAGPVTTGKTAHGTVSGGTKMSSPGYRLVLTVGESPGGGVNMSSPNHKLRIGTTGATQP